MVFMLRLLLLFLLLLLVLLRHGIRHQLLKGHVVTFFLGISFSLEGAVS